MLKAADAELVSMVLIPPETKFLPWSKRDKPSLNQISKPEALTATSSESSSLLSPKKSSNKRERPPMPKEVKSKTSERRFKTSSSRKYPKNQLSNYPTISAKIPLPQKSRKPPNISSPSPTSPSEKSNLSKDPKLMVHNHTINSPKIKRILWRLTKIQSSRSRKKTWRSWRSRSHQSFKASSRWSGIRMIFYNTQSTYKICKWLFHKWIPFKDTKEYSALYLI